MAMEDDALEEVVSILTSYYAGDHQFLVDQYGDQALSLAGDMGNMLEELFSAETPFGQLWTEYKLDPSGNETEVLGALEMLDESMPGLTIRLEGYYAGFQELSQEGVVDLVETSEPEATLSIEEIEAVKSNDDMDDDDEYNEENTYLVGNVEDRSTSAMYIEGLDTSIEPNQSETGEMDGEA
jgi:hypothetical protein